MFGLPDTIIKDPTSAHKFYAKMIKDNILKMKLTHYFHNDVGEISVGLDGVIAIHLRTTYT